MMERKVIGSILTSELPLADNQFTVSELIAYMRKAYGSKLKGVEFTHSDIINWLQIGSVPESYGGHLLTAQRMSGVRVLTVSGLSREDLRYVDEIEVKRKELTKKAVPMQKEARRIGNKPMHPPKAKRTRLYYQLAKLTPPPDLLPDNWKDMGIKGSQLKHKKKSKKKKR